MAIDEGGKLPDIELSNIAIAVAGRHNMENEVLEVLGRGAC